jgi:hypothetical protein
MTTRVIFETPALRATLRGPPDGKVILTFDHWRAHRRGFAPLATGDVFTSRGVAQLQVDTARNDWFLSHDLPDLLTATAGVAGRYEDRAGIGFSMGGYGLLIASRAMPLHRALFVSPQTTFTPDLPACPQGDTRFAADIADPVFAREAAVVIQGLPPAKGDCVVVYDPTLPHDAAHAREVTRAFAAPRLLPLAGAGHPASDGFPPTRAYGVFARAAMAPGIDDGMILRAWRRAQRDPLLPILNAVRAKEDPVAVLRATPPANRVFRTPDPFAGSGAPAGPPGDPIQDGGKGPQPWFIRST